MSLCDTSVRRWWQLSQTLSLRSIEPTDFFDSEKNWEWGLCWISRLFRLKSSYLLMFIGLKKYLTLLGMDVVETIAGCVKLGSTVKFLISKPGLSCCWSETMEGGGRRSNINYWLQSQSIFNRTSMISRKKNSGWIKSRLVWPLDLRTYYGVRSFGLDYDRWRVNLHRWKNHERPDYGKRHFVRSPFSNHSISELSRLLLLWIS